MLLRLTLHHTPASDLGYLLHKHPDKVFTRSLSFGQSQLFYPKVASDRCTAVLSVEADPIALSRSFHRTDAAPLEPYVNDRSYASGSFLAVALKDAFGTAMTGRSKERPQLAERPLNFEIELPVLSVQDGEQAERFFAPLGYQVQATPIALDPLYPEWDEVAYVSLKLRGQVRLQDLLSHLYVLLPAMDGRKHYFVDQSEITKLERYSQQWLPLHPAREEIVRGYLRFGELVGQVKANWDMPAPPPRAHIQRLDDVASELLRLAQGMKKPQVSVLDLGCGEGELLQRLLRHAVFRPIVGMDLSARRLSRAAERLHLSERPEVAERVQLFQGSLTYPDSRLAGFDLAALVEVLEHLEPHRLETVTQHVLGGARPQKLLVTTPNAEYNQVFGESAGLRHADHRFEWTRQEFQAWAQAAARQHGYTVQFGGLGDTHPSYGPMTQMAVFGRAVQPTEGTQA